MPDPATENPTNIRVVDAFLQALKSEGIRHIFGVPGGLMHTFFAAVEHDADLQLVISKHEQGAAYMADGYARSGHGLAVCAGTSGPGSTNLLTGVACAFADGVPMLVITGQPAINMQGRGASQEAPREGVDIVEMFRPVSKYSTMVTSADKLGHHLRAALRQALDGRQGPVHLNIPIDLWLQDSSETWLAPEFYRPQSRLFDRRAVQQAAELLVDARRPVILAGAGVLRAKAEEQLQTLAELIKAPVATSAAGKSSFDETHSLSLGVLGFAGHKASEKILFSDQVDILFSVGASLDELTTLRWSPELQPRVALLHNDIDAQRIGRNYPVKVPLVGDAQNILVELIYHIHRLLREGREARSQWQAGAWREVKMQERDVLRSGTRGLSPQRWRYKLNDMLPDKAIVYSDIGGHMAFNIHDLRLRRQQDFVLNWGFASMGHGTAAAVGARLACPDRPVIAIIGDACFTMNGMELLTAAEYDVPVLWIVENNNMHGIIWHGGKLLGGDQEMNSVRYRRPIEPSAIARSMGLRAWTVEREEQLEDVFREALACRQPALIELRVDAEVKPPIDARANSIAGFGHD